MTTEPAVPPLPRRPERILVVGSGGAGKSTLAQQVARRLELPLVHLDEHYWRPGWVAMEREQWRLRVAELIEAPRWVIDGNYSGTLDLRLPRADLIVFLDLPRRITLSRVLFRYLRWHGRNRPSMTQGCPERLGTEFLLWLWRYPRQGRVRLLRALDEAAAGDRLLRLTSRSQVSRWLQTLPEHPPRA